MQNPYIHICEICKKDCRPLLSTSYPLAAPEYYCERCHKSYPMEKKHVGYHLEMRRRRKQS